MNNWDNGKYNEVLAIWRRGELSKAAIGRLYNVGRERMRQIIAKALREENWRKRAEIEKGVDGYEESWERE